MLCWDRIFDQCVPVSYILGILHQLLCVFGNYQPRWKTRTFAVAAFGGGRVLHLMTNKIFFCKLFSQVATNLWCLSDSSWHCLTLLVLLSSQFSPFIFTTMYAFQFILSSLFFKSNIGYHPTTVGCYSRILVANMYLEGLHIN